MRLTKYGHCCLLVEDAGATVLLDPGSFSTGFEGLTGLSAVLITHIHPDHVDVDRLEALLAGNPGAVVVGDAAVAALLGERGIAVRVVADGDVLDLGVGVAVHGTRHAVIHPDLPPVTNVGYLLADRLFLPGDAFTVPEAAVEILGVPASAPWMRVSEAIEFMRTLAPRLAVPVHERFMAPAALGIVYGLLERLAPAGTTLTVLDDGAPLQV
jgi:L-ascorbate metabolism protein UlaG (beta-lactamase superfamily)